MSPRSAQQRGEARHRRRERQDADMPLAPTHRRTSVRSRASSGRLLPCRAAARRRRLGARSGACSTTRRADSGRRARPAAGLRARGGRGGLARAARARSRSAWACTRTGPRPRTLGPPAAIRRRASAATRVAPEHGLEPRFFAGGGWYTDDGVRAVVAEEGLVDLTATTFRFPMAAAASSTVPSLGCFRRRTRSGCWRPARGAATGVRPRVLPRHRPASAGARSRSRSATPPRAPASGCDLSAQRASSP